jgi:hypothetical protein
MNVYAHIQLKPRLWSHKRGLFCMWSAFEIEAKFTRENQIFSNATHTLLLKYKIKGKV